jgi:hypothetical protein
MTDFNRTESARWALDNQKLVGDLQAATDKALSEAAGRGFSSAPGVTLGAILAAGQEIKDKLTEANGKIYDDRRKVLFEQDEFAMKLVVSLAKLAMELYREELMNALAIEQAENTALRDQGLADVVRLNSEVDLRQRSIIQSRAEAERRVTALKADLVEAEAATLPYETALVRAQLATAEKKLEIIGSIYEVLAAEELVLAAENRRAETLTTLLAAQMVVAGVKREMIPFYLSKADARQKLAAAIVAEIPFTKAIIELGYERIELKDAEESAKHLIRVAENTLENAKKTLVSQDKATMFARAEASRLLQQYANEVRASILAKKEDLEKDGLLLKFDTSLARHQITADADKEIWKQEAHNLWEEWEGRTSSTGLMYGFGLWQSIIDKGMEHVAAIEATGKVKEVINSTAWNYQWKTIT